MPKRGRSLVVVILASLLPLVACAQDAPTIATPEDLIPQAASELLPEPGEPNRPEATATRSETPAGLATPVDPTKPTVEPVAAMPQPAALEESVVEPAQPATGTDNSDAESSDNEPWGPWIETGCWDATGITDNLTNASPAVAEAASPMPRRIWLCPNTPENNEKLACYPNTTERILAAFAQTSAEQAAAADEIRDTNTIFCAAGDVVILGPDGARDPRDLAD